MEAVALTVSEVNVDEKKKHPPLVAGAVYVRTAEGALEYGVMMAVSVRGAKQSGLIQSVLCGLEAVYPDRMNGWSQHKGEQAASEEKPEEKPVKPGKK